MGKVNVQKRGKVYQYQFEIARVNGKRKYISKFWFQNKKCGIHCRAKGLWRIPKCWMQDRGIYVLWRLFRLLDEGVFWN